ncbi:hypothetical protein [Sandarakinorhabdus rubra]|uniref:hypothetical protein n=1 Tax=Sandarakinorhabdus rubra TaxID=2672568 RepID=UPI0013DA8F1F|nr:hypothetical protein [Sandarakinorhabdus rubra]
MGEHQPDRRDRNRAPVLAMHGVSPAEAEPLLLLAEILGWQVRACAPGHAMPARLCLAPLPNAPGEAAAIGSAGPSLFAWSPENNLNELINKLDASVLEQPLCIQRLEQLLQILGHHSERSHWAEGLPHDGSTDERGRSENAHCHTGYGRRWRGRARQSHPDTGT